MTQSSDSDVALLYQALSAPIGLVVYCVDPQVAKQRLYKARKVDPLLGGLQLRTSPEHPATELWVVRESIELPTPGQAQAGTPTPEES